MLTQLSQRLLDWYAQNARVLPWRGHPDPYAVWVSESMLQQTRVDTVIPYFERWMGRFPSVQALAAADERDVLQTWEGLGYYSRARNLHKAAKLVVEQYAGSLPRTAAELQKLPGVGRYTAGAVASMAFGQDEPALDGNIRRVFARITNLRLPARSKEGEALLWNATGSHLPPGRAGDYNQALMDLGATICTPQKPLCLLCPLKELCEGFAAGAQEELPVMEEKAPVPHIIVTAAVIWRDGMVLIAQRPADGLLGGMWEFPGGKQENGESLSDCLKREILEELNAIIETGEPFGVYEHAYTHFKVTLHAFVCRLVSGEPQPIQAADLRWVTPAELADYPMGKIDRRISKRITGA